MRHVPRFIKAVVSHVWFATRSGSKKIELVNRFWARLKYMVCQQQPCRNVDVRADRNLGGIGLRDSLFSSPWICVDKHLRTANGEPSLGCPNWCAFYIKYMLRHNRPTMLQVTYSALHHQHTLLSARRHVRYDALCEHRLGLFISCNRHAGLPPILSN